MWPDIHVIEAHCRLRTSWNWHCQPRHCRYTQISWKHHRHASTEQMHCSKLWCKWKQSQGDNGDFLSPRSSVPQVKSWRTYSKHQLKSKYRVSSGSIDRVSFQLKGDKRDVSIWNAHPCLELFPEQGCWCSRALALTRTLSNPSRTASSFSFSILNA